MKKRCLAIFIMAAMLCQTFPFFSIVSAEETVAETLTEGYRLVERFDGKSPFISTNTTLEQSIVTDDSGERFYKITNPGNGPVDMNSVAWDPIYQESDWVEFSDDENMRVLSFDVKVDKTDYYGSIYIRTGAWALAYSITKDGYIIADWNPKTEYKEGLVGFKYEPGKWYTLTTVFNKESGDARLYKDYQGYGFIGGANLGTKLSLGMKSATGTKGIPNTIYLDNIVIGTEEVFQAENASHLNIVCEELGQAFFSKTVEFGVKLYNNTDVKKTYDVTTNIVSDLKVTEFTKSDAVELEPGESKVVDYNVDLARYAVYDLNVTSVDTETSEKVSLETQLVTLKKAEQQNPRHGIMDHSYDKRDGYERYPEKFASLRNIGMSAIRAEAIWNQIEKKPGEYSLPEDLENVFKTIQENDMEVLVLVNGNNKAITDSYGLADEMPMRTPKNIELFGKYAHNVVKLTQDYACGYDIWNEWNVIPTFNRDNLPGKDYVPIIEEAYKQTKAANKDAKVYGLTGMTWNRTELYKQMAEEMFENGVANYADGYTIHTYQGHQSPDTGAHYQGVEYTQGLMEKYGVGDKEIIITEMGWVTVNSTPEEVAGWIVKYAAMIHDSVDRIYWYCSQRKKRENVGAAEQSFGWMEDEREFRGYVPYAPLPQMRAMANYNSHIATAEKLGEIELSDTGGVVHRFKRTDGKQVAMAWIKDGLKAQTYAIKVDAPTVTICDIYGNEEEYATKDGKFYLTLTNTPQYIIGNFSEPGFEAAEFSVSVDEITIVPDDSSVFTVIKDSGLDNVKVEVETPDDITVLSNNGFEGDEAEIVVASGKSPKDDAHIKVKIVDKDSGVIYYMTDILMKLSNACTIDIVPKKALDGRWKIAVTLNNMRRNTSISGDLEVKEPIFNSGSGLKFSFENIGPLAQTTKHIYIPDPWIDARNIVKCDITLDSGETFMAEDTVNLNGIIHTDMPPEIDGIIEAGEWDKTMPFVINKESNRPSGYAGLWDGPEDLSARVYYNWDRDNLYVAAEVVDNELCDDAANKTWQNDGIQVAFALSNKRGAPRTEIGFGMLGGEMYFERTASMVIDPQMLGGIQDDSVYEDMECRVSRNGKKTYYEVKIPWEEIVDDNFDILYYDELYISILVNDNDGAGRRGWLEFCPGIGLDKDAKFFEKVKLFR